MMLMCAIDLGMLNCRCWADPTMNGLNMNDAKVNIDPGAYYQNSSVQCNAKPPCKTNFPLFSTIFLVPRALARLSNFLMRGIEFPIPKCCANRARSFYYESQTKCVWCLPIVGRVLRLLSGTALSPSGWRIQISREMQMTRR
jgi:hypothetical protein